MCGKDKRIYYQEDGSDFRICENCFQSCNAFDWETGQAFEEGWKESISKYKRYEEIGTKETYVLDNSFCYNGIMWNILETRRRWIRSF